MVAITALKPGDRVWSRQRQKAGNTATTRVAVFPVEIVEVHADHVVARWNGNAPRRFGSRDIARWTRTRPARV